VHCVARQLRLGRVPAVRTRKHSQNIALTNDCLNVDPHLQVRAVMLLARAAAHCDDDCRLRRVVPYLMVYSCFL